MTDTNSLLIGDKTFAEWDRDWTKLDGGLIGQRPLLGYAVGVYRLSLGGRITVVGTGTDKREGITKRFYDLCRPGSSSRNHYAGRLIYEHRDQLDVEVLITGRGQQAREIAQQLKPPMIRLYQPEWTVLNAPFLRKVDACAI